jgi:signal peptidase I
MANKNTEVATSTTEKVSVQGDKTVTTVTTTTTTTTTTTSKKKGWAGLKKGVKALIIAGSVIVLSALALIIIFGRVRVISYTMESTIANGNTVYFNRFATPEVGDVLVFHHPETDSIVPSAPDKNYYYMSREYGSAAWCNKCDVVKQSKKKRPLYLSRCIATPGDIVTIKDNIVYVNNKPVEAPATSKFTYLTVTSGLINSSTLDSLGLKKATMNYSETDAETIIGFYRNVIPENCQTTLYTLTEKEAEALAQLPIVRKVQKISKPKEHFEKTVLPYLENIHWNSCNFGPLLVPVKNKVLKLTPSVLPFYRRCIEAYEENKVEVVGNKILINDKEVDSYKFKRNYYFVLGDNRSCKEDSRYFGFVPDNHIKGVVCE